MSFARKRYLFQRDFLRFRFLFLSPEKRANLLRKRRYFKHIGEQVWYVPLSIPTEGQLVSIGNKVIIASGTVLVTHDELARVFKNAFSENRYRHNTGEITIGDNVFIGQNAIIFDLCG